MMSLLHAFAACEETVAQIAAKIRRNERGEPVMGVVDREHGD